MIKEQIQAHEGLRLHPYLDTQQSLTIGWGRSLSEKGISLEEADIMLNNDIEMAQIQYEKLPRDIRSQCNNVRKDIITEMIFQMGLTGTLKFRKMFIAVKNGHYDQAADEMIASLWYHQTPRRCRGMSNAMRSGIR